MALQDLSAQRSWGWIAGMTCTFGLCFLGGSNHEVVHLEGVVGFHSKMSVLNGIDEVDEDLVGRLGSVADASHVQLMLALDMPRLCDDAGNLLPWIVEVLQSQQNLSDRAHGHDSSMLSLSCLLLKQLT